MKKKFKVSINHVVFVDAEDEDEAIDEYIDLVDSFFGWHKLLEEIVEVEEV